MNRESWYTQRYIYTNIYIVICIKYELVMIMSSRICGGAQVDRQKKIYLLGGYCFLIRIWPGFWVTMTSDCFCINCNLIGHVLMCWFTCE